MMRRRNRQETGDTRHEEQKASPAKGRAGPGRSPGRRPWRGAEARTRALRPSPVALRPSAVPTSKSQRPRHKHAPRRHTRAHSKRIHLLTTGRAHTNITFSFSRSFFEIWTRDGGFSGFLMCPRIFRSRHNLGFFFESGAFLKRCKVDFEKNGSRCLCTLGA